MNSLILFSLVNKCKLCKYVNSQFVRTRNTPFSYQEGDCYLPFYGIDYVG